ncbi:hypothetical protein DL98DRAFT_251294 [Cadophora sp. DSE1049]|nr:hypothetical protein DL98DRAFT_251294 [Cadophora sp. DSE1049]
MRGLRCHLCVSDPALASPKISVRKAVVCTVRTTRDTKIIEREYRTKGTENPPRGESQNAYLTKVPPQDQSPIMHLNPMFIFTHPLTSLDLTISLSEPKLESGIQSLARKGKPPQGFWNPLIQISRLLPRSRFLVLWLWPMNAWVLQAFGIGLAYEDFEWTVDLDY